MNLTETDRKWMVDQIIQVVNIKPMAEDELKKASEAYQVIKESQAKMADDLANVLNRMKDSSRCWSCGAIQPSSTQQSR